MYELFLVDFTYRESGSRQVQLIFKLREFSSDSSNSG